MWSSSAERGRAHRARPSFLRNLALALSAAAILPVLASAEVSQRDGVRVSVSGSMSPKALPPLFADRRRALLGQRQDPRAVPFPSAGKVLAFNGLLRGKPVIFAHIYGTEPVPTSYVLPFSIASTHGTSVAVLEASLPQVTGEWGYVTGISLNLDRGFSAACPAPKGFPGAVFPLARTSFSFSSGLTLTSTLERSCKVR
jgi:hypothetical protein